MAESKEHRRFRILRLGYKYLSHGEEIFAGAGLLAVTVVVFMNVLTRYFLSFSFSWAEEITRYIMVAVAFIGAAICSRRGIHLAIDFFFNILPKRIRKVLAIAISLVGAAFTFRLTLLSLKYWHHALETGQRSAAMNVPMTIVYGPICVGCGLMCLHLGIAALKHGVEKESRLESQRERRLIPMIFLFPIMMGLLLLGFPIFISLGVASMTIFTTAFSHIPLVVVIQRMFAGMDNFAIMSMPFFILAANVAARGELSKRILNLAECMVGHFPGGLALTGILACMFFGAVSGSSPATVVAIGSLVYPVLLERGYAKDFSLGLVTSSSAVAIIIPPSITMILYAVVTGESVGALFVSGFGAGLVYGLSFMAYSVYYARKYRVSIQPRASLKKMRDTTLNALWGLGLPIIIIGGIYGGVFTPTEAAGVSAVYAIVIEIFVYKSVSGKDIFRIAIDSAITTAQVYILVAAGTVFAWLLIVSQTPQALTNFVNSLHASRFVILLIINFVFLIAGMFIDPSSIIVVLTPLFLPIALAYGISSLHLGIIVTVNIAIGMFSPPFGLNLFVASGLFKVPMDELVPGLLPFIVMSILALMIVTFVPQISLWLPGLIYSFK